MDTRVKYKNMGLDMYMTKKHFIWSKDRAKIARDKTGHNIKPERVQEIIEEVGYWRKANAIHRWFVENVQGGKDDCGGYSVSRGDLRKLLSLVKEVLADNSKAEELLPTQSGFFFGETEYDEWYFEDLQSTETLLTELLQEKDDGDTYYYHSSW